MRDAHRHKKNVLLGCKLELQANNAAHEGHGMLKPDAVKVERPVLREREGTISPSYST